MKPPKNYLIIAWGATAIAQHVTRNPSRATGRLVRECLSEFTPRERQFAVKIFRDMIKLEKSKMEIDKCIAMHIPAFPRLCASAVNSGGLVI
jgi:FixJ family two-component response regulator